MKKVLKSIICIIFFSVMLISLIACGANKKVIICFNCGYENAASTKFCSNCGTKFDKVTTPPSTSSKDNPLATTDNPPASSTEHAHSFSKASCTDPAKCNCGATNGEPLGHQWSDATCTSSSKCTRCGVTNGTPLGHTTSEGVCNRCNVRLGWTKSEIQSLIKVYSVYVSDIDSADGVDMKIAWENTSSKTIKYIYFTVEAYNAVNDKVYCEIRDYNAFTGKLTGPLEPGYTTLIYSDYSDKYSVNTYWEDCYYNSTIKYFVLTNIRIIYMDNTEFKIDKEYVDYAFSELPQGLTYLWDDELNGYAVEYRLRKNCTSSNISIPSTYNGKNVVAINDRGFANLTTLESITLPNTLKHIGKSAFSGCNSLTSIEIPEQVISIGSYAFEDCSKLNDMYIPDSVETMWYGMLAGCSNIKTISFPFLNSTLRDLFSSPYGDVSVKKVEIRGGTAIGDSAFSGCSSLTEIILPNTITTIGDSAFSGCNSLTNIEIPDQVISIGSSAFEDCNSLTSIEIPDQVISIGSDAFYNCSKLNDMYIPDSVETIGYSLLEGCSNVKTISIPFLDSNLKTLFGHNVPESLKKVEIRGGTAIGKEAFYNCNQITEIILPSTITTIGESAFSGCNSLAKIKIPDKVISIGRHAFFQCYSITEIVIPYGVESIDDIAFVDCTNLKKIIIPSSVKKMGYWVFYGCINLTVYCCANYQPTGWENKWGGEYAWNRIGSDNGNIQYCPVIWGYTE